MPKQKKTKKVSSKKKKELVKAIKNPNRYFKLDFGRYGGEVAMGEITEAQFNYWEGNDEGLAEHMANADFGNQEDTTTPADAKFTKPFYEYEDICHISGPELSDGQTMTIEEVNEKGEYLKDKFGNFDAGYQQIDMADFKKLGVKVKCTAEHNSGSKSCKDKYYVFGQYFNKGGWYTNELIKTDHKGFDFKKLKIEYENADGFKVFGHINYNGEDYGLEEDSTGKSSSFYVMEGDDV